jgi:hypothetical protein
MAKLRQHFFNVPGMSEDPYHGLWSVDSDASVGISDTRVAKLLLVLREIDESVAGLENLSQADLGELVSTAIEACGFTDPKDARLAIAAVLRVTEPPDPPGLFVL